MTEPLLGRSINRREDDRFVRGRGRYIADLAPPDVLHGMVVRSTHAHARIMAILADTARRMPGILAVLTGFDLAADDIGPLPCAATQIPMATPLVVPPYHALARDVVRHVGEPIAFVVAESVEIARDALDAIVVDYDPLPPVIDLEEALTDEVLVHDDIGTNRTYTWELKVGEHPKHVAATAQEADEAAALWRTQP